MRTAFTLLVIAVLTRAHLPAQLTLQQPSQSAKSGISTTIPAFHGKTIYVYLNEQAALSRNGDTKATTELTRQMFRNTGIPVDVADAFSFTDRVVQAESAYRNGVHAGVQEADIVKAVNNLAKSINAPVWVRTNQAEIRKLRMRLLVTYPQLFASQEPPDAEGHYKALSEKMSPVEAVYLATSLLFQKRFNADFQFTEEEQAQNAKLDPATVKTMHFQRKRELIDLLRGQSTTSSMRDLLAASDHLFTDLGIEQAGNAGITDPLQISPTVENEGGR